MANCYSANKNDDREIKNIVANEIAALAVAAVLVGGKMLQNKYTAGNIYATATAEITVNYSECCEKNMAACIQMPVRSSARNRQWYSTSVRGSGPNFRKLEDNSEISELPIPGLFATYRRDYAIDTHVIMYNSHLESK